MKINGKYVIDMVRPYIKVKINGNIVRPYRYNRFARGRHVFFFNDLWNHAEVSEKGTRKEIVINENMVITHINDGGNMLPKNGYIISFPQSVEINYIKIGSQIELNIAPKHLGQKSNFAVMGLPRLIKNNKINDKLIAKNKEARTAIGIKQNGEIVMLVAEHDYSNKIKNKALKRISKIMSGRGDVVQGLTSSELAALMHKFGCTDALNLDGGGSSSLYIEGKYLNNPMGDIDESLGESVIRPVSDAIMVKRK